MKTIALPEKPIEIGFNDQGSWGAPGSYGHTYSVTFCFMPIGEFRAKIDTERGCNQGTYNDVQGGEVVRLDCSTLQEAIREAETYISLTENNEPLKRAFIIAKNEALKWERDNSPELNANLIRIVEVLMDVVTDNISTGKAREILEAEGFPPEVCRKIMAPVCYGG